MVFLRLRTAKGTRIIRFRLLEKPAPLRQEGGTQHNGPAGFASASSSQNIYATVVQAHGIRTGIISPVEGASRTSVPAGGVSPLVSAATVTVKREEKPPDKAKGIGVPNISGNVAVASGEKDETELAAINIKYPLIPREPRQGETVFAYAHIFYDKTAGEVVYNLIEPPLDDRLRKRIEDVKQYAQEKLNINFSQVRKKEAVGNLGEVVEKALNFYKIKQQKEREVVKYYVLRDFIGLEKLEPVLNDRNIEDISCDGIGIPFYVYHRDTRLGSLKTNIMFENKDDLDLFVNKLSERCGKVISIAHPLLDAALPDGSRVQATMGSDIARFGSNFTIRMFTEQPLTPVDMIKFSTCDIRMMAFFWFLVEHGINVLVSGGTATGKTSLLNVLSLFIKPQMKIVSIEDTPELRLPHSHWVPEVARTPISEEGKVDMFELLRESLRQRPDYIIVGEVRGKEAYVLFQQMAVGHPGMSTLHAENFQKLVDRLTTAPISLPPNLLENLDLIVFLKRIKKDKKYKRRISSVIEIAGMDRSKNTPLINEVFAWDPKEDSYAVRGDSILLKRIADNTGATESMIQEEVIKRARVLRWMVNRNITDYKKTGEIFNIFYNTPEFLLQRIESI